MSRHKSLTLPRIFLRASLAFALASTLVSVSAARPAPISYKLLPDLVVKINGPATVNAGDNIGPMIGVLARNIGTAPAPGTNGALNPSNGFMIDVVLSTDGVVPPGFANVTPTFTEDMLLQGGRISNTTDLAAAASQTYPNLQGGTGKIPADTPTGLYRLCARIDPGSKVPELNESNNVACATVKVKGQGKPDLVTRLSAPAVAFSGSNIGPLLKLRAFNVGTGSAAGTNGALDPANGYMIDLVLSTDAVVPPGFATFSPTFTEDALLQGARTSVTIDLAAGASKLYATGAGIPADTPTGLYRLCARIDPGSKVAESNESNNVTCVRIKVKHP